MSLSAVESTLSSLKSCQTDIGIGMDIVTEVALDLLESQGPESNTDLKKLEAMMLECARLDREIDSFVEVTKHITVKARGQQQSDAMFTLKAKVTEQVAKAMGRLADAELESHAKVTAFKESILNSLGQVFADHAAAAQPEELDEDVAVTQSQVNLTCPLTQMEMVNPMKNKKCSHHYDEAAILGLINARHSQRKKCRCPVVGCGNGDVTKADLVQDQVMRRLIHKKHNSGRT
ncbi:E3 SUMO-protein ligase NSE2 [Aplochiton taeniatus]